VQVKERRFKPFSILFKQANSGVAGVAKQSAHDSGPVVVVHVKGMKEHYLVADLLSHRAILPVGVAYGASAALMK
jgi:hypothetical protein